MTRWDRLSLDLSGFKERNGHGRTNKGHSFQVKGSKGDDGLGSLFGACSVDLNWVARLDIVTESSS